MRLRHGVFILFVVLALVAPARSVAAGSPDVAALQVGLRDRGVYRGPIDGLAGSQTTTALKSFQRQAGLAPTGALGPSTRAAFGEFGRPAYGTRTIALGSFGWDVAAAQFLLAWQGFPSSTFGGTFGGRVEAALRRYQAWAGLPATGRADASTLARLKAPPARSPLSLAWPLLGLRGDTFGPRRDRFHTGVDVAAAAGKKVAAAGAGRVAYAGWLPGGWGYEVTVDHGSGLRSMYAHLSRVDVAVGDRVAAGDQVGLVGASGDATGPHLHFELRLRGAAIDPLTALPPTG